MDQHISLINHLKTEAEILDWYKNESGTFTNVAYKQEVIGGCLKRMAEIREKTKVSKVKGEDETKKAKPDPKPNPTKQVKQRYCVRCKTERVMKNTEISKMKNGREAVKGVCVQCGCKMCKIMGKG